ncbi:MAG: hypothetical protein ACI37Z_05915 [Candidatus Gastranaerophilaceae bacterium]
MDKYGNKTGGRQKGTPNKRTTDLLERLGNYNPLDALLAISQDENTPLEIQVKINLDLMNYVYPKRKSVEFNDKIDVSLSEKSIDELQKYLFEN